MYKHEWSLNTTLYLRCELQRYDRVSVLTVKSVILR